MSSGSLGSFALRLINSEVDAPASSSSSSDSNSSSSAPKEEVDMYAHVLGVFINLDTDKDGLITRHQLIQGLHLLGLRPTEVLLRTFVNEEMVTAAAAAAGSAGSANALQSQEERQKQSRIATATFSRVVMAEWRRVKSTYRNNLDSLFAFATTDERAGAGVKASAADVESDAAVITPAQLKHLLQGVAVDSKLSDKDFDAFMALLPFDQSSGNTTVTAVRSLLYDGKAVQALAQA